SSLVVERFGTNPAPTYKALGAQFGMPPARVNRDVDTAVRLLAYDESYALAGSCGIFERLPKFQAAVDAFRQRKADQLTMDQQRADIRARPKRLRLCPRI